MTVAILQERRESILGHGKVNNQYTNVQETSPTPDDEPGRSLCDLLSSAAKTSNGLEFYAPGEACQQNQTSYMDLLSQAQADARLLHDIPGTKNDSIFLLHFDNHTDNIRWFWAVTFAGYLPCISTSFVNEANQRERHILHLKSLLENPLTLVNERSIRDFANMEHLKLCLVESLEPKNTGKKTRARNHRVDNIAALMLTSGSTGSAKATCLTHDQMILAATGKSQHAGTTSEDIFLNWISLDHAVNLVEMHLHAMLLGAQQVHVQANDLLADPLLYLHLIDKHRVSITFAPNFFLDLVRAKALAVDPGLNNPSKLDLSALKGLYSGGEANDTQTAVEITEIFARYGNKGEFIRPGYGLTESCAGVLWGSNCPSYDVARGVKFTSVGKPIVGCHIRIMTEQGIVAKVNEVGDLQLSGPVISSEHGYYNDAKATKEAFSLDGWFQTGDRGYIDVDGQVNLAGRTKELLIINGFNHYPHQIELAIEQTRIPGVLPSFTVVFAHRPQGARTESYCVLYSPLFDEKDIQSRVETHDAIARVASAITNAQPFRIVPLPQSRFHRSSVGKLSRAKLRSAFEGGEFDSLDEKNRDLIRQRRRDTRQAPSSPVEHAIVKVVCEYLALNQDELSTSSNIFQLGFTSLDFFSLTSKLQEQLNLKCSPDLVSILRDPTITGIARAIDEDSGATGAYDPVVPLQRNGEKTPLWIVHPASGNVLAFLHLARYFPERPVYGLRSTGVKPGERLFSSFHEVTVTYFAAIRRTQPRGPYAIAGYSLGSSIAFEVSKLLEAKGEEVRFVGAFDSPPDIAPLVGDLTWSAGLVMVSFFYGLISETWANTIIQRLWHEPPKQALEFIVSNAEPARLEALQLDREGLSHVADITANFARACRDYHPQGSVKNMDVFIADPLQSVAAGRQQWMDEHLVHWKQFVQDSQVEFHQCDGSHADMLSHEYVHSFQRKLKAVLVKRGV